MGAINAAAVASLADEPADVAVGDIDEIWRQMRKRDVIAPLVGSGGLRTLCRMVGHTLGVPGVGLFVVLDPSPLADSLERWIE